MMVKQAASDEDLSCELAADKMRRGSVIASLRLYEQFLARNPDDVDAWLQKALLHADLSDFVAAHEATESAARIAPNDARVHFQLGLIASSFGRLLAAAEHFGRAYALEPENGEFGINLANVLLALDRWDAAVAIVAQMGDDLPGWWGSTRDQALTKLAAGKVRIQELLERRREIGAPLESAVALELAELFVNVGQVEAALPICRRLASEDAVDFAPIAVHARVVAQTEGIAGALAFLEAQREHFVGLPAYEIALARLCFEAGDLERGLRHSTAAGAHTDRRTYGMMMLAARRWSDLFGFCRAWMEETDDTGPFALLLRAVAGQGRLRLFSEDQYRDQVSKGIPRSIVQFWDSETVPSDVAAAIATWKECNPGFNHRLFHEGSARAFIGQAHGERAVQAFDCCRHPAMKADFFRICFLLSNGGFYVDADDVCVRPIEELLAAAGEAEFVASLSADVAPYVHNWFLGAKPVAPVLQFALEEMIAGVEQAHQQGIVADIWHTTGPGLVTRSVARWLARGPGAVGKALFLTTRQYRGFASNIEDLEYKKTAAGNWRRSQEELVTEAIEKDDNAFQAIYEKGSWGNGSGPGSHPNWTIEYRAFLERFIRLNNVRSIVDVGCGDWQFSRFLNLDGISYRGFDVVEPLVEENNKRFGSSTVRFDLMPEDPALLPTADLLLMKDVLQHLPDADIFRFRDTVFGRYRFALLTNSYEKIDAYRNVDLSRPGEFRCLDLAAAPYEMPGAYLFEYWAQPWERIRAFLVGAPS